MLSTVVFGRHVVQGAMRANRAVVLHSFLNHDLRLGPTPGPFHRQAFVAKFAMKKIVQTVLSCLPRLNQSKIQRLPTAHLSSAFGTNSGPVSERWFSGDPRSQIRRYTTSITRIYLMLPATSIARHSRVNSSSTVRRLIC